MALDTPLNQDGDAGWTGFRSRPDPLTLPQGIAARADDMRFVRGRAEMRKGCKRLALDIGLEGPLTLPFSLAQNQTPTSIIRSGLTVVVHLVNHGLITGKQINISGADQDDYNGDWIVSKIDNDHISFALPSGSPVTPATGSIVVNSGSIVRSSYASGIFASGIFSSPSSSITQNGKEWIVMAGYDTAYLWRDGEPIQYKAYPDDEHLEQEDQVSIVQAFNLLFLLRSRDLIGEYAPKDIVSLVRSGSVATITFSDDHGYIVGDRINISGSEQAAYNWEWDVVSVPTSKTLTFSISTSPSPSSPASGAILVRKVKVPLMWDGGTGDFIKVGGGSHPAGATYGTMQGTSIACYFNNQILMAPTPEKDTVLVSDVLDYNTYDPMLKSFRANAGSADHIIAMHPFADGDVLVMMRNSIYRAHIVVDDTGTSLDTAMSSINLLTNEVGCRAKNTVVTAGPYIYFLADQGVYRLDSNYSDSRLRGVLVPLSDAVTDQFEELNEDAVSTSCAVWYNNRYYIAVPTGGSDLPNTIFIWNALNGEWESRDTYPTGMHKLLVSEYNNERRLFAVSRSGGLFILEEGEIGDQGNDADESVLYPIPSQLVSRRYWMDDANPKRWMRALANMQLQASSSANIVANLYDYDAQRDLGSVSNDQNTPEDISVKRSIRAKAHSADIAISNSELGRWTLRNLVVTSNQSSALSTRDMK